MELSDSQFQKRVRASSDKLEYCTSCSMAQAVCYYEAKPS